MNVNKISFKLTCLLGLAKISKVDFENLKIGDILILESKINTPLSIFINDQESFKASIGHINNLKAIKIEKKL